MPFLWNYPLITIILSLFSGVLCMLLPWKAAKWYTVALECLLIGLASSVLWYTLDLDEIYSVSKHRLEDR